MPSPRLPDRSLVGRLIWLAAGWSVAVLIVAGLVLSILFHNAALAEFQQGLVEDIDSLFAGSSIDTGGDVLAPALTDARALRTYSGKYWEISEPRPDGGLHELARSRSLWDADPLKAPAGLVARLSHARNQTVFYDARGPLHQHLRVGARLAILPGRTAPVVFVVGQDRSDIDKDARRFETITAAALFILGVGLVTAVILQVRVGLAPLFSMGREVAGVRKGRAQRLVRAYPSELAPLAGELNALLDHNQAVVERQRTHVGNLAHALKTPISVMLAEAAAHPSPLAEVVTRQASAMQAHVDHHLRRARAAARFQTGGERTPVAPVLGELSRTLERMFQTKGVLIEWEADAALAFLGERQDLQEMAGNLLENACKWCRELVTVRAEANADPARLTLVVEDDGKGLPADQREAVLKRGARADESEPGSGLGLAIVDELARAYGGGLTLADSPLGGLKIELALPRAEG